MRIGVYAGSLRPGGGLTALRQVLDSLLAMDQVNVTVFTGTDDCSQAVQDLVQQHSQLTERRFHPQAKAFTRYLRSKFAFRRSGREFDWLFSVNYHIPSSSKVAVYHLNLLSFQSGPGDGFGAALKRKDARVACQRADRNLFESECLLEAALSSTGNRIHNPGILYLGVHPSFFANLEDQVELQREQLLLVSSMGAHKDNPTALRTLARLAQQRPDVDWRLKVAGGQSKGQWDGFLQQAQELGVAARVEILGPLDRSELSQHMRSSLCLINPSRIESFCMVALEAMASYCPAIVTSETSMPESVGDAAVVLEAGNDEAFTESVLQHFDDADFRAEQVARGRRRAESFRPEEFGRHLAEVLAE